MKERVPGRWFHQTTIFWEGLLERFFSIERVQDVAIWQTSFSDNNQEALVVCEEAILLDSHTTDAYLGKGNALYGLGNCKDALNAYEEVVNRAEGYKEAWVGKAKSLKTLSDEAFEKARERGYKG